jgi:ketosteroid isomerase-like protein
MPQENIEVVQRGYEQFQATGQFVEEIVTADFVWDMSHFLGWPEQQVYDGVEGARSFLEDWAAAWDDWELEVEALHDAGDRIVAVMRQRGRSKLTGTPVEMSLAQVWTLRDGKETRMDMYSDPAEALQAVGLAG